MEIGLHYSYDDPSSQPDPEIVAIEENIELNSPIRGAVWDLFEVRSEPYDTDKIEVFSRNLSAPEVELSGSGADSDWDTTGTVTALPIDNHTDRLSVGHVLEVEDEQVIVKNVDYNNDTIDVYQRGAGSTSAAKHGTSTITAEIIGNAHEEGNVDAEHTSETTQVAENYTQLVEESVNLTYTDENTERKTGDSEQTLKEEATARVMKQLARSAIKGSAQEPKQGQPGMARGLNKHLSELPDAKTTNVGGSFTETSFQNALDDIRKEGGGVQVAVMSVDNKRQFNTFTGADQTQTDRGDRTGGKVLDGYIADQGRIEPVVDVDMPNDKVALVDSRYLEKGWRNVDRLRFEPEPTNSRRTEETLQGKFSMTVNQVGVSHHLLTGLTT